MKNPAGGPTAREQRISADVEQAFDRARIGGADGKTQIGPQVRTGAINRYGSPRHSGGPDATVEFKLDRATYLKALGDRHPLDHADPTMKFVNRVLRTTIRTLRNDAQLRDALSSGKKHAAGTRIHSKAAEIARALVAKGKGPPGMEATAEKTLQAGKDGSRIDLAVKPPGPIKLMDYKPNANSAMASLRQAQKHEGAATKPANGVSAGKPSLQLAINWEDPLRLGARDLAKFLKTAAQPKSAAHPGSVQEAGQKTTPRPIQPAMQAKPAQSPGPKATPQPAQPPTQAKPAQAARPAAPSRPAAPPATRAAGLATPRPAGSPPAVRPPGGNAPRASAATLGSAAPPVPPKGAPGGTTQGRPAGSPTNSAAAPRTPAPAPAANPPPKGPASGGSAQGRAQGGPTH